MNIDTVRDIEPAHVDVCPVTGLPIRRESEWTDVNFGKDYRVTLTILGDSILLSQVSGYATMPEMEHCLAFVGNVATQAISGDRAYVHIADYTNLQETSIEARKYFVEFIKKIGEFWG